MAIRMAEVKLTESNPITASKLIEAYLPAGYHVTTVRVEDGVSTVQIAGEDYAGWTLDGYVIPRLASGNYYARETTDSV